MYVHSLVVVLLAFASPYFSRALASAQTSPDKTFGDQCYEGAAFGYDGASKDTSRGRARLAGSTTNLYTFEDRVGTTANRRNQSSAAGSLPTVDGPLHATRGGAAAIRVTEKGLQRLEANLALVDFAPTNSAMVARLRSAMAAGTRVTGADANFYLHEIAEGTFRLRGLGYDAAHAGALGKYGVTEFSLYHPEVIGAFPEYFNNAWRAFWRMP